jgi:hypothetical protein
VCCTGSIDVAQPSKWHCFQPFGPIGAVMSVVWSQAVAGVGIDWTFADETDVPFGTVLVRVTAAVISISGMLITALMLSLTSGEAPFPPENQTFLPPLGHTFRLVGLFPSPTSQTPFCEFQLQRCQEGHGGLV